MIAGFKNPWLLPAFFLLGIAAIRSPAQTFTTLENLTAESGANPTASLFISANALYGTASVGGDFGAGTVFRLKIDGTGLVTLHSFTNRSDGGFPGGSLVVASNILYGTASGGGDFGSGSVFVMNTNGSGFATLYNFTGSSDGGNPYAGMILSGSALYGTCLTGGNSDNGCIFRMGVDGTGPTTLHSFEFTLGPFPATNNDGAGPQGELLLLGGALYGTAPSGGAEGLGTVFKVNTDGTGFVTLYSFGGPPDGANPYAGLVASGNTLYGTTSAGGASNLGTIFQIDTDGSGFATLYNFGGGNDGGNPYCTLVSQGNVLYGTASTGGVASNGTAFSINADGSSFTELHTFSATSGALSTNLDGANPKAALTVSGNTLYGTAENGGAFGKGTVFSISLPPSLPVLAIAQSQGNLVLTWPTNVVGFTLQAATNLVPPTVWTLVSPGPIIVNGQNSVAPTNQGIQQFFRLAQ